MSWQDRIKKAAYVSPLGFRIEADFEDVSKSFEKQTSSYEFPATNGTYVQDLGRSGRRYPMRFFLTGENYDRDALRFEAELQEKGVGRLEHPIYGIINVVPFGAIRRIDNLKTEANQAIIEVVFWETILELYAGSITDIADLVFGALTLYNEASSGQLNTEIVLNKVFETTLFKNTYNTITRSFVNDFANLISDDTKALNQFSHVSQSMIKDLESANDINVKTLGNQTNILTQTPSVSQDSNYDEKVQQYSDAIINLISVDILISDFDDTDVNEFHTRDFYSASYISALCYLAANTTYTIKTEAISVADTIITIFEQWTNWHDNNYKSLDKEDTGDLYGTLQELVSLTVGYLVELSFTLRQEKTIVLTSPTNMIPLVAKLYGNIDESLDLFINSNNLTGSEMLELPRGKEIVYYV